MAITKEEINKILGVLITADRGCGPCVGSIFKEFATQFKEIPKEWYLEYLKKIGGYPLDEIIEDIETDEDWPE